jgi:uncharacterized protein (TIGR02594 family)
MSTIASLVGPDRVLRQGDIGEDVKAIQKALALLGYKLNGTGYFGPATDTAVSSFQKLVGVDQDGVVGPTTAALMDKSIAAITKGGVAIVPEVKAVIERPLWLEAGIKFIGTKETPGAHDNKVIIDWAKEEGGGIAATYTHDSIPWCALFANMMMTKVGIKGTETLWALDWAGKWPAVDLKQPAVGAMAPMLRNGGGHIMCVVGRDQHGNIMGLGGNQSDAVNIRPFARSRLNKGFWWPMGVALPAPVGFDKLPIVQSDGKVSAREA